MYTATDLEALTGCAPLPKTAWLWPVSSTRWQSQHLPILSEVARTAGSIGLQLSENWEVPGGRLEKAHAICTATGARLCVLAQPYAEIQQQHAPTSAAAVAESLRKFAARADKLAGAFAELGSGAQIGACVIDSEGWFVDQTGTSAGDERNRCLTAAWTMAHAALRESFPTARIIWYSRFGVRRLANEYGWSDHPEAIVNSYYTGDEPADHLSTSLYHLPEWHACQEQLRRTVARADAMGIRDVIPFVGLGGYVPRAWTSWPVAAPFEPLAIDPRIVWLAGYELCHGNARDYPARYAPSARIPCLVMWPAPLSRPGWVRDWRLLLAGAHNQRAATIAPDLLPLLETSRS